MSNEQELLCGVDSDTGQISYYFNPNTGEVKWVNQPSKEISKQIPTHVPSQTSTCCATEKPPQSVKLENLENNGTPFSDYRDHVQTQIESTAECSNVKSGELITVVLEPWPDSGEKPESSSSVIMESNTEMAKGTWKQNSTDTGSSLGVTSNRRRNNVSRKIKQEQDPATVKAGQILPNENDMEDTELDKLKETNDSTESGPCNIARGEIIRPVINLINGTDVYPEKRKLLNKKRRSISLPREKRKRTMTSDLLLCSEMPTDDEGGTSGTSCKPHCSANDTITTAVQFESSSNPHRGLNTTQTLRPRKHRKSNSVSAILECEAGTCTKEKPFQCEECRKCFRWRSELTCHVRRHTGEKPHKCNQCGKCFRRSCNLARHVQVHSEEKPYKCKQCGTCFRQSCNLARHYRIHSQEKPHYCKQCGKCFSLSSNLARHVHIHSGRKPYKCKQCGKCFSESSTLIKHARIHSGVKPYNCKQCGKFFSQSSNLARHVRIHVRNTLEKMTH